MLYAKEPRQNKDGTTSVTIASTLKSSLLRELGITAGETELDQKESPGVCVVCGGELQEKIESMDAPRGKFLPVEPKEPIIEMKDGYFCTECDIRYEFIPDPHIHPRYEFIPDPRWSKVK